MNKTKNILWGIVFIVIGLTIGLNLLGIINFDLFFEGWWTLFIIIPSAIELVTNKNKKSSLMFLVIGILILLDYQNLFDISVIWKLAAPAALIFIGIRMILNDKAEVKTKDDKIMQDNTEYKEAENET